MLLLASAPPAAADGKFYARSGVNLSLPYQRALLGFNGTHQVLVIQSQVTGAGDVSVGWVVPVPAAPDVGVASADVISSVFDSLDHRTRPKDNSGVEFIAIFVIGTFVVMNGAQWLIKRKILSFLNNFFLLIIVAILAAVAMPAYQGVSVTDLGRAGDYQAKVVRATDARELIAWLNGNGFAHTDADSAAFDAYIRRGWVFVVATLAPTKDQSPPPTATRPLVVQFAASQPVYPLALTGLSGSEVQLQLYLIAEGRMDADARLRVDYAGNEPVAQKLLARVLEMTEFAAGAKARAYPGGYLTRLSGRLKPEEMREDLALRRASSDADYRRVIWWGSNESRPRAR